MNLKINLYKKRSDVYSIVSLVKTNDNAAQNIRLSNGNLEIQVREMISEARRHLKIDRERFKKTYITEITNLVRTHESMFGTASTYTAIKKVYDEWNNLERAA